MHHNSSNKKINDNDEAKTYVPISEKIDRGINKELLH